MSLASILLRRRMTVQLPTTTTSSPTPLSLPAKMSVIHEMMELGFIPSKELFDRFSSLEDAEYLRNDVIPAMRELVGADVTYTPMYKNFPTEVMEKNMAELWLNAIVHYWTDGMLMPVSEEAKRPGLPEADKEYRVVGMAGAKDGMNLFRTILNSTTPYSPQDKADIGELCEHYRIEKALPPAMPHKENIATVASIVAQHTDKATGIKTVKQYIRTATDVLRLAEAVYGCDGPTTLDGITINKLSRADRRAVLSLIEGCKNTAEDMKTRVGAWVRVGEILHPGEYQKQFPKAYEAFNTIRDKNLIKQCKTFNAKSEQAIENGDWDELAKTNPGMVARSLARMLRKDATKALRAWQLAAPNVSPALLWTVVCHLYNESGNLKYRTFVPKNSKHVIKAIENTLPEIPVLRLHSATSIALNALTEAYKNKPPMGAVYVDPKVAQCKVPNDTRTASMGRTLAKGSEIPFGEDKNILRTFVWWTNHKDGDRVDIDLSAMLLDENLKLVDTCAYFVPRSKTGAMVHSGDIVNGNDFDGAGVAEFIDVDIKAATEAGARYIISTVHSFSRQPFTQTEHAHTGFMLRTDANKGEIFEPSTVKEKIKLGAPSCSETVCAFDLIERKMIWIDSPFLSESRHLTGIQNIAATRSSSTAMLYHVLHLPKPNILDVIGVNLDARGGRLVNSPKAADVIVALENSDSFEGKRVVTPYDLDIFAGDLMPDKSTVSKTFWLGCEVEHDETNLDNPPEDTSPDVVDMDEFGR